MPKPQPINRIYEIMDEAGLTLADITTTKEPLVIVIQRVRTEIATKITELMAEKKIKIKVD